MPKTRPGGVYLKPPTPDDSVFDDDDDDDSRHRDSDASDDEDVTTDDASSATEESDSEGGALATPMAPVLPIRRVDTISGFADSVGSTDVMRTASGRYLDAEVNHSLDSQTLDVLDAFREEEEEDHPPTGADGACLEPSVIARSDTLELLETETPMSPSAEGKRSMVDAAHDAKRIKAL